VETALLLTPRLLVRSLAGVGVVAATLTVWAALPEAQSIDLTGAGATLPYPIYSAWFAEYGSTRTDVRFNYQSIGSGAGIRFPGGVVRLTSALLNCIKVS
jgi:phosphate transport system substrate-binding protein